ncbi:MAG: tRNA CCA-pyrophosphorylase [Buchnera aphidicola (Meitanaphis flavogallis)]
MKIYLVGGAIRNKLLRIPVKDRDWVVIGATPETLLNLNFKKVGKDFPVFLHPDSKEEYSLARIDKKFGLGYTGFKSNYSQTVTLKEDLIRRDLTINAIAQDQNGNYIDFFSGLQDLKNRILRHVSSSFCEDPLRILRVARFSAALNHFGFCIAQETMQLMIDMVKNKELLYLTKDRIWKETEKALMTKNPHVYFQILYNCNALSIVFPEINLACQYELYRINTCGRQIYFKSDFFLELAKISNLNHKIEIQFAYLCNIICQLTVFNVNLFSIQICDEISKNFIKILCQRFRIPSHIRNLSIVFSGFFKFLSTIQFQSSKKIILFFNKIDAWRKPDRIKQLSILLNLYIYNTHNERIHAYSSDFLESVFGISKKISIKPILNSGFLGIAIKNELVRLRVIAVDTWRKSLGKDFSGKKIHKL